MGIIIILNNAYATTGPKLAQGVCLLLMTTKEEADFYSQPLLYVDIRLLLVDLRSFISIFFSLNEDAICKVFSCEDFFIYC